MNKPDTTTRILRTRKNVDVSLTPNEPPMRAVIGKRKRPLVRVEVMGKNDPDYKYAMKALAADDGTRIPAAEVHRKIH